jgi:hypothetical protein
MDEPAQDAGQQAAHQTQQTGKHWHSDDDSLSSADLSDHADQTCSQAGHPAPASTSLSTDFQRRVCSPHELPPPTVVWAIGSDGGEQTAAAKINFELAPLPDMRCKGDDLGRDRLPDAPSGNHPPGASKLPAADPMVQAGARAGRESVGHWIDAALADEGWWGGAREGEGAVGRMPFL